MNKLTLPTMALATSLLMSCSAPALRSRTETVRQEPAEGADLVGRRAPEFVGLTWVNCKPLTISALKGKPIFLRFWLGDCGVCQQSMTTANYLHRTYSQKGLIVIGIHHPLGGESPLESPEKIDVLMHQWGIKFPIALDNDWKTIKKYWIDKPRQYRSASMLIDRKGIIRWVHPGGLLGLPPALGGDEESPDFENLQHAIEQVVNEKG